MTRTYSTAALTLALIGALGACSQTGDDEPAAEPAPAAAPADPAPPRSASTLAGQADWAGKWIGVEGMFVEITPTGDGTYSLTMQSDLDTVGTYLGEDAEGGIAFERGGERLLLKPATGDETGLKYLADKSDCLMVAEGEGYCRN